MAMSKRWREEIRRASRMLSEAQAVLHALPKPQDYDPPVRGVCTSDSDRKDPLGWACEADRHLSEAIGNLHAALERAGLDRARLPAMREREWSKNTHEALVASGW